MTMTDDKPWLTNYDPGVAPEVTITDISYVELLQEGLSFNPDRAALHFMGRTIRFRELDKLSACFARFLADNGYGPGHVVGINMPNIPEYPIALAGALRAGCAVTGISPLLTAKEMAYQINDAGADVVVVLDSIFEERLISIRDQVPGIRHVVAANVGDFLPPVKRMLGKMFNKIPGGKVVPIAGKEVIAFKTLLADYPPDCPNVHIAPDDTCLIQYTGGTTGVPKGTVLTHRNMVANNIHCKKWVGFEIGQDVLCSGFPYFHLAGLAFGMLAMCTGNAQCLIPDPRNTRHICGEIKTQKPTVMANVPTLYQMLLDDPRFKALDFSSLKVCVSGAAPFSVESIQAMESVVGSGKVMEVYGMTEASPLLTMNPFEGRKKIGSVGVPIQNTRIKLVDLETGTREVDSGEEGELIARGPQVMKEYHNKPAETAGTLRDFNGETWLYTGDVARMDTDGYVYIVDRAKDMLIVGGYKVFSREVEETLYQHPAVEFCAIVGVPNPDRPGTELVKAVIQPAAGAKKTDSRTLSETIMAYCRETMAPYKVPKIIEIMEAIPLTAVGKVDKKVLR